MPINTLHSDYVAYEKAWARCRDAAEGLDAVRDKDTTYLPRLGGQDPDEYDAYLKRAPYLEAFARTVQGLSGAVFRKDPIVEHHPSEEVEAWLNSVDGQGKPIARFAQCVLDENLTLSRVGIWLTMDETPDAENKPKLLVVPGENIINWDEDGRWVVLREKATVEGKDRYERKEVDQWRLLELNELGQYEVSLWRKSDMPGTTDAATDFVEVARFEPRRLGQRLDFIPFWVIAGDDLTFTPRKPDLLGLADASFDHYRLMADYRHGLHWTALPTPWFAGFQTKDKIVIGSGTAIVSDNAQATAGMLEFEGQGLTPLKEAIDAVMEYMASLGARLLERPKRVAEAAETIKLRATAEQTTVQSMAKTVAQGVTQVVRQALWWGNMSPAFFMELNTDLVDAEINTDLLRQLSADLMAGHISYETYYYNLKKGEVSRPNVSAEEERQQIEQVDDDTFGQAAG